MRHDAFCQPLHWQNAGCGRLRCRAGAGEGCCKATKLTCAPLLSEQRLHSVKLMVYSPQVPRTSHAMQRRSSKPDNKKAASCRLLCRHRAEGARSGLKAA